MSPVAETKGNPARKPAMMKNPNTGSKREVVVRAYSYLRFSRKSQAKGDSYRRQIEGRDSMCGRHGWTLDESFRLEDLGVSSFRGKNAIKGKLGLFLEAIKAGKIAPGSVLIIENVDRLSRQEPDSGMDILREILRAGVLIATILPERIYDKKSLNDLGDHVGLFVELARAHAESQIKSERSKANWIKTRRNAQAKGTALHTITFGWLDVKEGRYEPIPDRVQTVKLLFQLARQGLKERAIARKLNRDKVPTFGRSKVWSPRYVKKVLTSRAVFGEGRPRTLEDGVLIEGDPIAKLYPVVVSEDEFLAAQHAMKATAKAPGRGTGVANLFTGILMDKTDNCSMYFAGQRSKKYGYLVASSQAIAGKAGSHYNTFPYSAIEASFLQTIEEIKPTDILPPAATDLQTEITNMEIKIQAIKERLASLQAKIADPENVEILDTLLPAVKSLRSQQKETQASLDTLKTQKPSFVCEIFNHLQTLSGMLLRVPAEESTELRGTLRARISALVEKVEVEITRHGDSKFSSKTAEVVVYMKTGKVVWYTVDQDGRFVEVVPGCLWFANDAETYEQLKARAMNP